MHDTHFVFDQRVTWTITTRRGRAITIRAGEGTFISADGPIALVRGRSGRRYQVALGTVRAEGQPNALTEMLGMARAACETDIKEPSHA